MNFSVPILLIVWRRPDTTALVVEAIRRVRPSSVFIASDGPRLGVDGESEKVIATRELVLQSIDWECTIKTRFSDVNLGCRDGVSSAISWFFENVSEGIILEDDVVPYPEFFEYCQLCLEKYREDCRVWAVCGNQTTREQHVAAKHSCKPLHLRYNFNCWGWATWRNRWQHYIPEIDVDWIKENKPTIIGFCGARAGSTIISRALLGGSKKIDTWDYQVSAISASRMQYTINPAISLIRNVGFGADATHTIGNLSSDYFYEVSDIDRRDWIVSCKQFVGSTIALPPFLRDVSDLAYSRKSVSKCIKRYVKKLLKLIGVF
jgi:hypothetical protein